MQSHEIPQYTFEFISMDVFFAEYRSKKQKFLVTVDHYSDFFELDILTDLSAETIIQTCKKNFSHYGVPVRVCTDNETNFDNNLMKNSVKSGDFILSLPLRTINEGMEKRMQQLKLQNQLLKKVKKIMKIYGLC
jgi:hypothetical protein